MIQHVVQKKRVIVMDCDITIGEDLWKKIMRHVLGRHFADLRGKGPGWSFSHTHLNTFCSMVEEHLPLLSNEQETSSTCSDEGQQSVQNSETQTTDDEGQQSVQNSGSGTQTTDEEEHDLSEEEQQSVQNSLGTQTTDDEEQQSSLHDSETQTMTVDEKSVQDNETQTCFKICLETNRSEQKQHVYKFDVDDQVRFFVDHWTQKAKFLV